MILQTSLLILLSINSCFGCPSCHFYLTHIENNIELLKADFNSTQSDVADGGPLFTEMLKRWTETTEKNIILSQIVSMYLKMFKNIGSATSGHIGNINRTLYSLNEKLKESFIKVKDLQDLEKIQINDLKIQRKAVNELFPTLQKLLVDPSATHIKRKRSQSQKRKCRC